MLRRLPPPLRGVLALAWFLCNILLVVVPLAVVCLLKAAFRAERLTRFADRAVGWVAWTWLRINLLGIRLLVPVTWEVEGVEGLRPDDWYLVLANHQSWLDIVVLQRVFADHIPFLKFFIKKQLIWVPVLGLAWWALDFPFMHRHSREALAANPDLRGQDLDATRRSCERFRATPNTVMNFVEGTRFTEAKQARQDSPFRHLLRPRAGGVAFVLEALGDRIHQVLDVTIAYPGGETGFWAFLCGRVPTVRVAVETLSVATVLRGDYEGDPAFRRRFQGWVNELWTAKDERLEGWKGRGGANAMGGGRPTPGGGRGSGFGRGGNVTPAQ